MLEENESPTCRRNIEDRGVCGQPAVHTISFTTNVMGMDHPIKLYVCEDCYQYIKENAEGGES